MSENDYSEALSSGLDYFLKYTEPDKIWSKNKKQKCGYCGGHTTDDERGNCAACGAPRKESQYLDPQYEWIDVTAFGDPARVYIQGPYLIGEEIANITTGGRA